MSIATEQKVFDLEQRIITLEAQLQALASVVRQMESQSTLRLKNPRG